MERCPSCGQLGRVGAKFCTICGHRLATDAPAETPTVTATTVVQGPETPRDNHRADPQAEETVALSGWPTGPEAPAPPETTWAPPASEPATNAGVEAIGEQDAEALPSVWAAGTTGAWPAAPPSDSTLEAEPTADVAEGAPESAAEAEDTAQPDFETRPEPESEPEPEPEPEPGPEPVVAPALPPDADAGVENARARAVGLLDELAEAIAAISGDEPPDLSGVISELEVAVTPPGAIEPETLAELREALLSARERPRDIDTVVDLTSRLDGMVALVIAYDRTIAAIERSLEALRRP